MEAGLAQPLEQLPLAGNVERPLVGNGVHEGGQVAPLGDARVLLAQRARRGIARVGEGRAPLGDGGGVEHLEAPLGHVHLAPQLKRVGAGRDGGKRPLAQAQRHIAHGAHVHGHVLAGGAVAAGGRPHKHAVLIGKGNGAAIDLQLAAKRRQRAPAGLFHAPEPCVQLA